MGLFSAISGRIMDEIVPNLYKAMRDGGSPEKWERIATNSDNNDNIKKAIALYLIYECSSYDRENSVRHIYFERKNMLRRSFGSVFCLISFLTCFGTIPHSRGAERRTIAHYTQVSHCHYSQHSSPDLICDRATVILIAD